MTEMTGGQALVKSLYREGVRVVFGLPGVQTYHATDALSDEPAIRFITTRNETATTYMADGYARAARDVGTALVVPGPGLLNATSGLGTAYAASSPVLLISGQINRDMLGKGVGILHEIDDQLDVVRPSPSGASASSNPPRSLQPFTRPSSTSVRAGPVPWRSRFPPETLAEFRRRRPPGARLLHTPRRGPTQPGPRRGGPWPRPSAPSSGRAEASSHRAPRGPHRPRRAAPSAGHHHAGGQGRRLGPSLPLHGSPQRAHVRLDPRRAPARLLHLLRPCAGCRHAFRHRSLRRGPAGGADRHRRGRGGTQPRQDPGRRGRRRSSPHGDPPPPHGRRRRRPSRQSDFEAMRAERRAHVDDVQPPGRSHPRHQGQHAGTTASSSPA